MLALITPFLLKDRMTGEATWRMSTEPAFYSIKSG